MIRHTDNPTDRAASIADQAEEEVWREKGPGEEHIEVWLTTYRQALRELAGLETTQQPRRL